LPDPLFGFEIPIHPALLDADQVHPAGAVTATDTVPPALGTF
jgi:hypothetical protein